MAVDLARETFTDLEPVLDEVHGIWDDSDVFTKYRVSCTFTGKLMGGVPQKPEAIEGWIRQRITGGDAEMLHLMRQTLEDLEIDTTNLNSAEELQSAARRFAAEQHGNTFRRDANGLFLSDYQIKAAIKENVNILYAGDRWGKTKKGPKSFVAERVFVDEPRIYLGRTQSDGMHLQVGHVTGPKGPRSTLTYYDYCEQPTLTFTLSSLRDEVEADHWKQIFLAMQRNGIGAIRSMGYGQFRVTAFDRL
ncbi:MAG: hypothetical protein M3440_06130 [Chloroflexota bacterium]|nr:hypothetical protein [Chloroflexota bacterium]